MSSEAVQASRTPRQRVEVAAATRAPLERVGLAALVLLAPAALVYLSFNAGGYFPTTYGLVAVVLAQALLVRTALAARPFEGFSRTLAIPLLALALYAGWQLLSLLWAKASAEALDSYDLTLVYLLALTLFGSFRWRREQLGWLLRALFAGIAAVCVIGLISRALPHVWPTSSRFFADRLNYPLTYWNAEGMLAALALILGFHLSADRVEHKLVRVLAAATLPALAATLLLTFSRGALAVAIIGLLVYCLLTRPSLLPSALLAAAPPVAVALRAAWDATRLATDHPTSARAVAQGHHVAVVVGACVLAAALLRTLLLLADGRIRRLRLVRRPPARAIQGAALAAVIVLAVAVALALGGGGFAHREVDKFIHNSHETAATQTRERLADPTNDDRLPLWKVAVKMFEAEPLRGTGAGTYQLYYTRYRSRDSHVVDAHSLYLQSLAELGIVGLALILLVVLGVLGGLASRIRGRRDRAFYAALFAATLAWAVHQAVDWDWQMPAVSLGVIILAGAALARRADGRVGMRGLPLPRTLVALAWLLIAITPLLGSISYARVQDSVQALKRGDCVAAKRDALASLELSAKRPQAYTLIGVCDLQRGYAEAAVPAMEQAAALEPRSWEGQFWLAVARAAVGSDPRPALRRAIALNPLEAGLRSALRRLRPHDPRLWERLASRLRGEALSSGKLALTDI